MKTYIIIRAEYIEAESSKYRLTLSQETSILSLQHQADKNFTIVLQTSPMDPRFSYRVANFETAGVPVIQFHELDQSEPRIEVHMQDDDFLFPGVVQQVNRISPSTENCRYHLDSGYLFVEGEYYLLKQEGVAEALQISEPMNQLFRSNTLIASPSWIHTRHRMNYSHHPELARLTKVKDVPQFKGWHGKIVEKICRAQMLTGTAIGKMPDRTGRKTVYAKKKTRR